VIGLGIIGARVAAALRSAGLQTYVWNRTARPAPNFLGSPAEVAESAEVIQIFVADAEALFDVVEAMSEALSSKHVIICSATVGPEAVLEAAQLVQARGAQFLDAPFTGSRGSAEKRELVYYVGGDEAAFLRAKPILELTSKAILRLGDVGHAATIKVVTNMISGVTTQVLAEALSIVRKAGLEPEMLTQAIELNACRSGVIDLKLPKMINGDYEPHFSLKHMFKDVQLGIHMANALDIEIPATTVTAGVMYGALNSGWGDLDYSVVFKNYTPSQIFEELPALEQVLGDTAPPEEPLPSTESLSRAQSPSAALTAPAPVALPVTPVLSYVPPATLPPVISTPVPAGQSAPLSPLNGTPAAVPTEEAARIIEAVLAHVTSQRGDLGPVAEESRSDSEPAVTPPAESVTVSDVEPKNEADTTSATSMLDQNADFRPESPAATLPFDKLRVSDISTTASVLATATVPTPDVKPEERDAKTEEAAAGDDAPAAESAEAATEESKSESKPINFVRRWFVGRSQS
jgi:3-hydroxyisobutyrate dehydrogenase-like beta-hydroxyacid dehydrogenase